MYANTKVRIVDLDSTISDDKWRLWMIDPQLPDGENKYHAYHIHCDGDELINRYIIDESPCEIVFMTARPECVRQKTINWLREHKIYFKVLLMRPNDDHCPSVQLKHRWLKALRDMWMFEFEKAYDDREDIVNMFNKNGVKGILVV